MLTVGVPTGLRLSLGAHSPIQGGSASQCSVPVSFGVKVLHLIDTLEVGGAEVSLVSTLPRLRSTESVVCQIYRGSTLAPAIERAGIRVKALGLRGRYAFASACREVASVVRAERPTLVHATLFRAGMIARAVGLLTGVTVVDSFVNDSYAPERYARLTAGGRAKLNVVQAMDLLSVGRVARFLAISRTAMRVNCRALGVDERRCTVIYRGRDPAPYAAQSPESRLALRRALGVGEDEELVLSVARLFPRKGQESLIRAFREVLAHRPKARLFLAGEGPARAEYKALAGSLGLGAVTVFLGTREDVPALLQAADLFVFPSCYEGLGGALVEAMLAACPIVAADIPVHRESIEAGVTGLLVQPAETAAFAAAMSSLLDDRGRAAAMGARARAVARERFAIDGIARQYDEFYNEVAREAGR